MLLHYKQYLKVVQGIKAIGGFFPLIYRSVGKNGGNLFLKDVLFLSS
jgi:hypothetical protein